MDRGAWWATVHSISQSRTFKQFSMPEYIYTYIYIIFIYLEGEGSLIAQLVKNPPEMQGTPVWFLGGDDLLEKR